MRLEQLTKLSMRCPHCGITNAEDTTFCRECKNPILATSQLTHCTSEAKILRRVPTLLFSGTLHGQLPSKPLLWVVLTAAVVQLGLLSFGVTTWIEQGRGEMPKVPQGLRVDTLARTMSAGSMYYDAYLFNQELPRKRIGSLSPKSSKTER